MLGNEPRDVSAEKKGYDIESRDPRAGHLRFIEVKGRHADGRDVIVTKNEGKVQPLSRVGRRSGWRRRGGRVERALRTARRAHHRLCRQAQPAPLRAFREAVDKPHPRGCLRRIGPRDSRLPSGRYDGCGRNAARSDWESRANRRWTEEAGTGEEPAGRVRQAAGRARRVTRARPCDRSRILTTLSIITRRPARCAVRALGRKRLSAITPVDSCPIGKHRDIMPSDWRASRPSP